MAQYRKRPVVVEAVQFDPQGEHRKQLPPGVRGRWPLGAEDWSHPHCEFWVITIHGQQTAVVAGDWIITEPDGFHHYPCKPDIFEASYEPEDPIPHQLA